MAKTASPISKAATERLVLEIYKAAHSIGAAFGERYNFKNSGMVTEHQFINWCQDAIPLARVVRGGKLTTPERLPAVGVLSVERLFRGCFAGDSKVGWAAGETKVTTRSALEEVFKMLGRSASQLNTYAKVYFCEKSHTLRFDLYVETKNLEANDKTAMWLTICDHDLVKLKPTNPFQK